MIHYGIFSLFIIDLSAPPRATAGTMLPDTFSKIFIIEIEIPLKQSRGLGVLFTRVCAILSYSTFSFALKKWEVGFAETFVPINHITQCHISTDNNLHIDRRENLESYILQSNFKYCICPAET
jgi:hypothetical protein